MKFTMFRNRTVATSRGHIIEFLKGVPTHVPPECYDEVIAAGAIPEDEMPDAEVAENAEPNDPAERRAAMFDAFEKIVLRNNRDDFAASGAPNGKALNTLLGWPVESKERVATWNQFKSEKGEAAE